MIISRSNGSRAVVSSTGGLKRAISKAPGSPDASVRRLYSARAATHYTEQHQRRNLFYSRILATTSAASLLGPLPCRAHALIARLNPQPYVGIWRFHGPWRSKAYAELTTDLPLSRHKKPGAVVLRVRISRRLLCAQPFMTLTTSQRGC